MRIFLRWLALTALAAAPGIPDVPGIPGVPGASGVAQDSDDRHDQAGCDDAAFTSIFDGETLDGWIKRGGEATYTVEDRAIVGTVGPGRNTFLCTEKEYADFELRLDFRFDDPCNSGIQFRSHVNDRGVVYGYQSEIDPSARAWTCGVYDESRRGWLFNLKDKPEAQRALKKDDWNAVRIRAVGDHIQTWLNDVPCADFRDDADASGFIALQVHSGSKGQLRWRNIRIREIEEEDVHRGDAESAEEKGDDGETLSHCGSGAGGEGI